MGKGLLLACLGGNSDDRTLDTLLESYNVHQPNKVDGKTLEKMLNRLIDRKMVEATVRTPVGYNRPTTFYAIADRGNEILCEIFERGLNRG